MRKVNPMQEVRQVVNEALEQGVPGNEILELLKNGPMSQHESTT